MKSTFGGVLLVGWATAATASGSDAWARFDREVAQRCAAASKLVGARTSTIVGFDDSLDKVATLVSGREMVRTRRGTTTIAAKKLCIYDKRTKRAWVDEAAGWNAPDRHGDVPLTRG